MAEIGHFAVGADGNGRLEIVAIARPAQDDEQFTPAVWLAQELPDGDIPWPGSWRSLGAPGGGHQFDGITMTPNADGGLEVAVLAQNRTVWHARQANPDGDWSGWTSLGNPVSGGTITPPALVQNQDGRLELCTVSLLPRFALWHRSQQHPGQDQWTGWSSLGWPAGQGHGPVTAVAPAVTQNQDGRLEVHLRIGGQIWHSWQQAAGGRDWVPWASLGHPGDAGPIGLPTVALDVDGRLQVLAASGPNLWVRGQHGPGLGPWDPWKQLSREGSSTGEPALAVAAQDGGRLVLFALRSMPDGTQSLEKLEQEGGAGGLWLAGDPVRATLLGNAAAVPKADNPALASDGHARLRLFLSIPGSVALYNLNQASAGGGQWLESWIAFQAP